jgi:uncharacterized protein DUF2877
VRRDVSANSGVLASSLVAPLVDGPPQDLRVVHRCDAAWQLADERGRVLISVITSRAVRLPHAVVVPSFPRGSSPISAGGGSLGWDGSRIKVARWFEPARPTLPSLYPRLDPPAVEAFARRWAESIGRGDGLTPYCDDVVCGALVALTAARHPAADAVAVEVEAAALERQTTALSAALLRLAARGYCIDPLARFLTAVAASTSVDASPAAVDALSWAHRALLAVGHSSGRGLVEGVLSMLGRTDLSLAAA